MSNYETITEVQWGPAEHEESYDVDQELAPRPRAILPEPCQCAPGATCLDDSCLLFACFEECSKHCPTRGSCRNKRLQNKEYKQVQVIDTPSKGQGLVVLEDVEKGELVYEYVGEAVLEKQLPKLFRRYKTDRKLYIMALGDGIYLDACRKGSVARFINHSCEPNCRVERWKVKGRVRAAVIAIQDIAKGTELSFDYKWERRWGRAPTKCHCGTPSCRGTLEVTKTLDFELFKHPGIEWQEITRYDQTIVNRAIRKTIGEEEYVYAEITGYNPQTKAHHVLYSAEKEEWEDLTEASWMILDEQITLGNSNFIIAKKIHESKKKTNLLDNMGSEVNATKNYLFVQTPVKEAMKGTIERVQISCKVMITTEQLAKPPLPVDKDEEEDVAKFAALEESLDGTVWKLTITGTDVERARDLLEKGSIAIKRRLDEATPPPPSKGRILDRASGEIAYPRSLDKTVQSMLSVWRDKNRNVNLTQEREQQYSCLAMDAPLQSDLDSCLEFLHSELKSLCVESNVALSLSGLPEFFGILGGSLSEDDYGLLLDLNGRNTFFDSYERSRQCLVFAQDKSMRTEDNSRKIYFGCASNDATTRFIEIRTRVAEIKRGVVFVPVDQNVLTLVFRSEFPQFISYATGVSFTIDPMTQDRIRIDGKHNTGVNVSREVSQLEARERVTLAEEAFRLQCVMLQDDCRRSRKWMMGNDWSLLDFSYNTVDNSSPFQQLDFKTASQGCADIAEISALVKLDPFVGLHASIILYRFVTIFVNQPSLKISVAFRDVALACLFIANKCQKVQKWRKLEQVLEGAYQKYFNGASFDKKDREVRAQASRVIDAERQILDVLKYDVFFPDIRQCLDRLEISAVLDKGAVESVEAFVLSAQSLSAGAEVWLKFGLEHVIAIAAGLMNASFDNVVAFMELDPLRVSEAARLFVANAKLAKPSNGSTPSHPVLEQKHLVGEKLIALGGACNKMMIDKNNRRQPPPAAVAASQRYRNASESTRKQRVVRDIPRKVFEKFIFPHLERIMTDTTCQMFVSGRLGTETEDIILKGSWRAIALAERRIANTLPLDVKLLPSEDLTIPQLPKAQISIPYFGTGLLNTNQIKILEEENSKSQKSSGTPSKNFSLGQISADGLKECGFGWWLPRRFGTSLSGIIPDFAIFRLENSQAKPLSPIQKLSIEIECNAGDYPALSKVTEHDFIQKERLLDISLTRWPSEKTSRKESEKWKATKGKAMKFGFSPGALQEVQLLACIHETIAAPSGHPNFVLPISVVHPDKDKVDKEVQPHVKVSRSGTDIIDFDDPVLSILNTGDDGREREVRSDRRTSTSPKLLFASYPFALGQMVVSKRSTVNLTDYPVLVSGLFYDILSAVAHCHDRGIVLGYVHPDQILIDQAGLAKVGTLSRASVLSKEERTKPDDPLKLAIKAEERRKKEKRKDDDPSKDLFVAPEILLGCPKPSRESDMWSTGCLLAQILIGKSLFLGKDRQELLSSQFKVVGSPSENNYPRARKYPKFRKSEKKYSRAVPKALERALEGKAASFEKAIDLIAQMLCLDPRERLTAAQALDHDVIREFVEASDDAKYRVTYAEQWGRVKGILSEGTSAKRDVEQKEKRKAMLMSTIEDSANGTGDDLYDLDDLLASGSKKPKIQ